MTKQQGKDPPRYSEKILIGLIKETTDLDNLTSLCKLYRDLEEQGDIDITQKINREVQIQQKVIIYGGDLLGDKKN